MFGNAFVLLILLLSCFGIPEIVLAEEGKSLGPLYQCAHNLKGEVFVKNEREIVIKGFTYDGTGPAAWFHGQMKGSTKVTTDANFKTIPYPNASCERLEIGKAYNGEEITVIFPASIKEFESIGVYCYKFCHNFGHVIVPADLDVPAAPASLMQVSECAVVSQFTACTADTTKQGLIMSDCPGGRGGGDPSTEPAKGKTDANEAKADKDKAGAGEATHIIVPSVLVTMSGFLAILMTWEN